jgi:hypothetical protein
MTRDDSIAALVANVGVEDMLNQMALKWINVENDTTRSSSTNPL